MDANVFKSGFFHNESQAYEFMETLRWPNGPVCVHCKHTEKIYRYKPTRTGRRVLKCGHCRKQFTVTLGTIFEDSHLPLTKWMGAYHLLCASKKGMSAHQLHRMLGITYKSAWFMAHRIRHSMKQNPYTEKLDGIVEADETYIGGMGHGKQGSKAHKKAVFTLLQRGGKVRSFHMVAPVTGKNLKAIIRENVSPDAQIMTNSHHGYHGLGKEFASHETVNHAAREYAREKAHVYTAEGYFSLLKRGINGTFHHASKQHLHRYLSEFDFRYNARKATDDERTVLAVRQVDGKRLQYR